MEKHTVKIVQVDHDATEASVMAALEKHGIRAERVTIVQTWGGVSRGFGTIVVKRMEDVVALLRRVSYKLLVEESVIKLSYDESDDFSLSLQNIPCHFSDMDIHELVSRFGSVCRLVVPEVPANLPKHAYVYMLNRHETEECARRLNGYQIDNCSPISARVNDRTKHRMASQNQASGVDEDAPPIVTPAAPKPPSVSAAGMPNTLRTGEHVRSQSNYPARQPAIDKPRNPHQHTNGPLTSTSIAAPRNYRPPYQDWQKQQHPSYAPPPHYSQQTQPNGDFRQHTRFSTERTCSPVKRTFSAVEEATGSTGGDSRSRTPTIPSAAIFRGVKPKDHDQDSPTQRNSTAISTPLVTPLASPLPMSIDVEPSSEEQLSARPTVIVVAATSSAAVSASTSTPDVRSPESKPQPIFQANPDAEPPIAPHVEDDISPLQSDNAPKMMKKKRRKVQQEEHQHTIDSSGSIPSAPASEPSKRKKSSKTKDNNTEPAHQASTITNTLPAKDEPELSKIICELTRLQETSQVLLNDLASIQEVRAKTLTLLMDEENSRIRSLIVIEKQREAITNILQQLASGSYELPAQNLWHESTPAPLTTDYGSKLSQICVRFACPTLRCIRGLLVVNSDLYVYGDGLVLHRYSMLTGVREEILADSRGSITAMLSVSSIFGTDHTGVVVGSLDGYVRIYEATTGPTPSMLLQAYDFPATVCSLLHWHNWLFVGLGDGSIVPVLLLSGERCVAVTGHVGSVTCLAYYLPPGMVNNEINSLILCSGGVDQTVRVTRLQDSTLLAVIDGIGSISSLLIQKETLLVARKEGETLTYAIADLLTSVVAYHRSLSQSLAVVTSVAAHPSYDHSIFAACSNGQLRKFHLESGTAEITFEMHQSAIECLKVMHDLLISGDKTGLIRVTFLDPALHHTCLWQDCGIRFGELCELEEHLQSHANEAHCLWMNAQGLTCGESVSKWTTGIHRHRHLMSEYGTDERRRGREQALKRIWQLPIPQPQPPTLNVEHICGVSWCDIAFPSQWSLTAHLQDSHRQQPFYGDQSVQNHGPDSLHQEEEKEEEDTPDETADPSHGPEPVFRKTDEQTLQETGNEPELVTSDDGHENGSSTLPHNFSPEMIDLTDDPSVDIFANDYDIPTFSEAASKKLRHDTGSNGGKKAARPGRAKSKPHWIGAEDSSARSATTPETDDALWSVDDKSSDPYRVLNVRRTASSEEIRARFIKLAKHWHPDRNAHRIPLATMKSTAINLAYGKLKIR